MNRNEDTTIKIWNRETNVIVEESMPKGSSFLYDSFWGKLPLMLVTTRFPSLLAGIYLNSKMSKRHIEPFIRSNHLDMSDYEKREYSSFNDFFSRRILPSKRMFRGSKEDLLSPADAKFMFFPIRKDSLFEIKEKTYTLESILQDDCLAKEYEGGYFLVFRLTVDCYHRYAFIDDGKVLQRKNIKGKFHTVGPIAFRNHKVYEENQREYAVLQLENFGKVVQMEVGALLVGKIVNNPKEEFVRGEEKGYFLFGGSTVILLMKKNTIILDKDLEEHSRKGIETYIHMGEKIGKKVKKSD